MMAGLRTVCAGIAVAAIVAACAIQQEKSSVVPGTVVDSVDNNKADEADSRVAAIIVDDISGSAVGEHIGQFMNDEDRIHVSKSLEYSRTGQSLNWHNRESNYDYMVIPTRTYEAHGIPCREFTLRMNNGERQNEVYGTACRQADGNWRLVN